MCFSSVLNFCLFNRNEPPSMGIPPVLELVTSTAPFYGVVHEVGSRSSSWELNGSCAGGGGEDSNARIRSLG